MRSDSPYESSLDHIALDMTSQLELGSVLASIADGLVRDFGVALARVWLLEAGDDTLRLRASAGLSGRLDGSYAAIPVGARKIGQIAERGAPVVTNDLVNDPRIADHAWARENGLRSFAGWPLTFRGATLGVLAIFSREAMTEERKAPMELFVHQAAIAIKNARLFAEVTALEERLRAENAYLRREVVGGDNDALALLSRSEGLGAMILQLRQVGPTSTTVLIQGETGTGKELVARALHEISPRSSGPLVKVNCAALSPALVESELFGHEKGAFTGAQQQRTGRFELASGGTLFLDEIGELPLDLQPKLLRVLQEGELDRVGGSRPVRVNVRIVSATNRDLRKAVDEGRFRADLFYRLAVFTIEVPSLRERARDVEGLAQSFLRAAGHRLGKRLEGLAPDALRKLRAHDWPGNVRELSNVIERAAIVASGSVATADDLPPLARRDGSIEAPPASSASAGASPGASREPSRDTEWPAPDADLDTVERWHIERVLRKTNYVIEGKTGAAAVLGLAPSTLRSRMAQLRIKRPSA